MKLMQEKDLELLESVPGEVENVLRLRRQTECFAIADRAAWYDSLTPEQKQEVQAWRKAWLDVTETHLIPKKPDFIR